MLISGGVRGWGLLECTSSSCPEDTFKARGLQPVLEFTSSSCPEEHASCEATFQGLEVCILSEEGGSKPEH